MTENYEPTHREKFARADIEKERFKDELEENKKEDNFGIFTEEFEERYAEAQKKLDKLMAEGHEEALELKKEHERLKRELGYAQKFAREITWDTPEGEKALDESRKAWKELEEFEVSKLEMPPRSEKSVE
jgi:hypothetical protein